LVVPHDLILMAKVLGLALAVGLACWRSRLESGSCSSRSMRGSGWGLHSPVRKSRRTEQSFSFGLRLHRFFEAHNQPLTKSRPVERGACGKIEPVDLNLFKTNAHRPTLHQIFKC
jgi:hypothetical protein